MSASTSGSFTAAEGAAPIRGVPAREVYGVGSLAYRVSLTPTRADDDALAKSTGARPRNVPGAPYEDAATAIRDPMHTVNTAYFKFRKPPHAPSRRAGLCRETSGVASSANPGPSTELIARNTGTTRRRVCSRVGDWGDREDSSEKTPFF